MIRKVGAMSSTKEEIRGCIDLGSSYFRLLVVRGRFPEECGPPDFSGSGKAGKRLETQRPGIDLHSHYRSRRYIGWGDDLLEDGKIPSCRIDEAADALAGLVTEAAGLGCENLHIVATNTVRNAENRPEILERFRDSTGRDVSVLTSRGEAAYGLAGAATLLDEPGSILFADPGGTSTEIAWSGPEGIGGYSAYPYGSHTIRSMLAGNAPGGIIPRNLPRLVSAASEELRKRFDSCREEVVRTGQDHSFLPDAVESPTILFTGGTAITLAVFLGYMRRRVPWFTELAEVSICDLDLISRRLAGLFCRGMERNLPLAAERVGLLIPGLILIRGLAGHLGAGSYLAVTRDLRWGVILSGDRIPGGYRVDE